MPHDDWRPDRKYRADSFTFAFCDDPGCGLHLVGKDRNDKPMCEIVMSPGQTLMVIEACKDHLYEKAAKRDK